MSKVRINDLARELEVKSKSILDALTAVGVTEKKTHSSSIEEDEAEKVRGHLTRGNRGSGGGNNRPPPGDNRQGFNLSHVSKPGDALKAILERKQAEVAARNAPASRPASSAGQPNGRPPVTVAPASPRTAANAPAPPAAVGPRPPLPSSPVVARPAAVVQPPVRPASAVPPGSRPATPPSAAPVAASPVAAVPASAAPAATAPTAPAAASIVERPAPAAAQPAQAPPPPGPPAPPARRIVMPQPRQAPQLITPPPAIASRPVQGPVVARPPANAAPPNAASAGATATQVGRPSTPLAAPTAAAQPAVPQPQAPVSVAPEAAPAAVPAPPAPPAAPVRRVVMPQTGPRPTYTAAPGAAAQVRRPIFERPRPGGGPGGPGGRPGFGPRPGGPGGRPGFGGPRQGVGPGGLLPPADAPPAPGTRPGRPPARGRGNQRYVKDKEVALKGYAPRMGAAQIPEGDLPITRTITVTEGISVKDLAEKLEVRGKDLIATLLLRGVMVTVNQSLDSELVKSVARQFVADAQVISVEEQLENEAIEGLLEDT